MINYTLGKLRNDHTLKDTVKAKERGRERAGGREKKIENGEKL